MTKEEGSYTGEHSVKFTEVAWYERLGRIATYFPGQMPLFAAVTITFWGVAEVISELGGETLSLRNLALPALCTALGVSVHRALSAYSKHVPVALGSESHVAQSLFRRGRSGWQFALAREMLIERIRAVDRKLDRVQSGAQYIVPTELTPREYFSWLKGRPEVLLRLTHAAATQCTVDFPKTLASATEEDSLFEVKDAVEQLYALYREAANFEENIHSVKPPEKLTSLHQMMFGWSDPIRGSIAKFLDVLDAISTISPKRIKSGKDKLPDLAIKFDSPKNIDQFCRELRRLGPSAFEAD